MTQSREDREMERALQLDQKKLEDLGAFENQKAAQPAPEELEASNQRMFDLVRYARAYLHDANLITDDEYSVLCQEHAAVKRLEDYDELRQRESALQRDRDIAAKLATGWFEMCRKAETALAAAQMEPTPPLDEILSKIPAICSCDWSQTAIHAPTCLMKCRERIQALVATQERTPLREALEKAARECEHIQDGLLRFNSLACCEEGCKIDDASAVVPAVMLRELQEANLRLRAALAPPAQEEKPRVVCLCGSTRFYEYFQRANYEETMAGRIVLSVGFYPHAQKEIHHSEDVGCTPEQKIALDELHKRKIDLADEVLVLNVGGYIGSSTRGEIEHAIATGKPVRYLEPPPAQEEKGGLSGESYDDMPNNPGADTE